MGILDMFDNSFTNPLYATGPSNGMDFDVPFQGGGSSLPLNAFQSPSDSSSWSNYTFPSIGSGGGGSSGTGLSDIFGKNGAVNNFVNEYSGAFKLGGGILDYFAKKKMADNMRGMVGPQQGYVQNAIANNQYWDQSARNAQMGTDSLSTDAMRQAQMVAEREGNRRGINPIHVRLAAQQAMADPRLKAVQTYGNLAQGYGNNVSGGLNSLTNYQTAANKMKTDAYSSLGAGLFGPKNPMQYQIVDGRLVPVE